MEREPTTYSRPLVFGGLGVVLFGDIAFDIPNALFVGVGATVLLGAAVVHFVGDEHRAAAGWGFFALALAFFGVVDVGSGPVALLGIGSLLVAGLALQVSQRIDAAT
ncbi:hypothetical protein [Natronomonas marina]|jgi:hypothetical protein|uniref:hypothetical protein n=1 Tax=Natronomonas marina TaxID=2961939 RepID=UPI0020C93F37|nr:hypothetical protein [Natronomonas marina]